MQRNLPPEMSHEEGMKNAAETISLALPALEETGVTICVEPLGPAEGNFLLTADKGVELIEMIGSPNVRLHLDVKAMSTEATTDSRNYQETCQVLGTLSCERSQSTRAGDGRG